VAALRTLAAAIAASTCDLAPLIAELMQSESLAPEVPGVYVELMRAQASRAASATRSFRKLGTETFMNGASVVKAATMAVVIGLAGCQDLKPLQTDISNLSAQIAKLRSDEQTVRSSADHANSTAQSASQEASAAQSTANQGLASAQTARSAVDATNEKIDRMFKHSISK
jgi:hypothetical protein